MGTPKVKRTDIEKLIFVVSDWLSASQDQKVSAERFLSCLADSTVLNRILLKVPEVNHDISGFVDKVDKDSESNGNFNTLKETCIKQLGIKEEEFFDQSILTITDNTEATTNDNYIKLMQTIVIIAVASLKSSELASKMSSELKEYLAGELSLDDLEIDDISQWKNPKNCKKGHPLQASLSEIQDESQSAGSEEFQEEKEVSRNGKRISLQNALNQYVTIENLAHYFKYFQEAFFSEKGTMAAVSLFVLTTAIFLATFEFIGDEDIPCWWDPETLYVDGDTYGYFCIFEPNEYNNLSQPTEFYAELSRDGVNPFAEMELLDRRWIRGCAVVVSSLILAIQQQEQLLNFYETKLKGSNKTFNVCVNKINLVWKLVRSKLI